MEHIVKLVAQERLLSGMELLGAVSVPVVTGIETVGGELLSSPQVSRKSGGVCPAILAV